MDGMNVDDVSANFSNLSVTTNTFLSLPWLVKWHIYMNLYSRDCIALSSTCRQMYDFNTFAYTHLLFLPPNSLFSLARSIQRLSEVLARSPRYAEAVRTLRIVGWNTIDIPGSLDPHIVYRSLDEGVSSILEKAPHIFLLTLDLDLTRAVHQFPQTFAALTRVRTMRNLRLATFLTPTYHNPLLERIPIETPPAYERVSLRVCSGGWLPIVMQDPRKLRWFGLTMLNEARSPGDTNWAVTLHRVAEAATELETLVLENGEHFDADSLGQMLQFGFVRGVLRKLRSFSVNTNTLNLSSMRQLFCGFPRSSITHLRIIINCYGTWLGEIGPQYILELARFVPDLEEISLDQLGMVKAMPLPGDLTAWGEAFRTFKKLRRIAFASMFVLDLCSPETVNDDEGDYEEEGKAVDEDSGMEVDDGPRGEGEGDEGYETDDGKNGGALTEDPGPNFVQLAAWADMFLGEHLRMAAPFAEILFIDRRFSGRTAAGFSQRVLEGEGEGGRAEHMIFYPMLKRYGWWWDGRDPMPLD